MPTQIKAQQPAWFQMGHRLQGWAPYVIEELLTCWWGEGGFQKPAGQGALGHQCRPKQVCLGALTATLGRRSCHRVPIELRGKLAVFHCTANWGQGRELSPRLGHLPRSAPGSVSKKPSSASRWGQGEEDKAGSQDTTNKAAVSRDSCRRTRGAGAGRSPGSSLPRWGLCRCRARQRCHRWL